MRSSITTVAKSRKTRALSSPRFMEMVMNPHEAVQCSMLAGNARHSRARHGNAAVRTNASAILLTCLALVATGCSSGGSAQASNAATTTGVPTDGTTSTTTPVAPSNSSGPVSPGVPTVSTPTPSSQPPDSPSSSTAPTTTAPGPEYSSEGAPSTDQQGASSSEGVGPVSDETSAASDTASTPSVSSNTDGSATGPSVSEDATIVPDPAWACGMEGGIPSPKLGTLAFTITFDISAEHEVGTTPYGHRRLLDVSGGKIAGDRLQGSVLTGGLEYELELSNGVMEYQGINVLNTSDGSRIFVRSCGVAADGDSPARIIPDFEATTSGSYAFLNTGKWVATREVTAGTMKLDVYDVANVATGEPRITLHKPEGVPAQPWECNTTKGNQGAEVLTENVTLGASFSIANAKYGSRNVIPITGGTTTGRVKGKILNGGADYQLSGSLDAWYTLAPDNGEFILVRNCGPGSGLIPWFEAAVDGEFNFLNTNAYLSSSPSVSGSSVNITFYDRQ